MTFFLPIFDNCTWIEDDQERYMHAFVLLRTHIVPEESGNKHQALPTRSFFTGALQEVIHFKTQLFCEGIKQEC